ncbi:MAG: class I SAM-dependent methyltransferase [Gammaproteobacteria bacterium]|nr:class I SAM-dependent methyltransferase [Gammaproteobacteria bacterium]NNM14133.1 class I SAM-dependent methyltransferase [Gammaproteobacteria bacterium]
MSPGLKKSTGDMFGGHAQLYAEARPTYPEALYDHILSLCAHKETVWDVATGNGQAAVPLAKRFERVFATDINQQQIASAIHGNNIVYSVQSAESTDFQNNNVDLVSVAQALHWFDYAEFWPEVDRVLKPGGLFAAWGYDWTKIDFEIDFQLQKNLVDVLEDYWNPKAQLLWGGYQAEVVNFPYARIASPDLNIELYWTLDQLFQYFLSWSSTQAYMKDNGTDFLHKAKQQVAAHWGDSETRLIQWPIHTLFGYKPSF